MLDQFFSRPATIARYLGSPYAAERQRYLLHLEQEGRSQRTLRSLLPILNSLERHLPLQQATITQVEIEAAAEMWATTVHRSRGEESIRVSCDELASPAWTIA